MASSSSPLFFSVLTSLIFLVLLIIIIVIPTKATYKIAPMNCSANIPTCNASLYHITKNLTKSQIAFFYNVDQFHQMEPITRDNNIKQDYLVYVPCTCRNSTNLNGYFYETSYIVKQDDTFQSIADSKYSGQAWAVDDHVLHVNESLSIYLPCGCSDQSDQIVVTYTVQLDDTPAGIADLLMAELENMNKMNGVLAKNPRFIDVGFVLFIPRDLNRLPKGKRSIKLKIIIGTVVGLALLSLSIMLILFLRRKSKTENPSPKAASKRSSIPLHTEKNKLDKTPFQSEKPVIFSLEEIEEATNNFDETRKIGAGGYGCVYFGTLGDKEVAIKKMKSNKSKEFYAELKVLCRVHHINIVELLGYASGEDNLYLVYEYVPNGSLSDHLHDPLLKGYQPLPWNARVQIALDTAKGLEYIHDYTKARYVHRDVKTSNILLDEKLRAKVADFGLAKLVERTNGEEFIATRLVGTPGYLPPESVKELQVTPKTDVFAFGVVLSELVTGKRALFRDDKEANKMKSLITLVKQVFEDRDPESALEKEIDRNLQGGYRMEDVYKMTEIAERCLKEDPKERPEMREIGGALSQLVLLSLQWEASLETKTQCLGGLFTTR